jgi:hypothetical protein
MASIVVHGLRRLAYFLSDQKVDKKSPGTHDFPDSPSSLLTSVFGVGAFDWTVTNIHVSAFLGCFECRRLKTSCFKAAPPPSLSGGCRFERYFRLGNSSLSAFLGVSIGLNVEMGVDFARAINKKYFNIN